MARGDSLVRISEIGWQQLHDDVGGVPRLPICGSAARNRIRRGRRAFGCDVPRRATRLGRRPRGPSLVGPAGRLLDQCAAGSRHRSGARLRNQRGQAFKWEPRGKRRIHAKPNAAEIVACLPWLQGELSIVKPRVLVCLGATAAQALLGRNFRVTQQRGKWVDSPLAPFVMATVHPASILRAPDSDTRHAEMARFVADLRVVGGVLHPKARRAPGECDLRRGCRRSRPTIPCSGPAGTPHRSQMA